MRIDKFIWCVRLAKTRTIASELCQRGKVKLNGTDIKPSKDVVINDELAVKDNSIWRTYKIIDIPQNRISAKLIKDNIIETTSEDDLLQLKQIQFINKQNRIEGIKGRPTKKDRRSIDKFKTS